MRTFLLLLSHIHNKDIHKYIIKQNNIIYSYRDYYDSAFTPLDKYVKIIDNDRYSICISLSLIRPDCLVNMLDISIRYNVMKWIPYIISIHGNVKYLFKLLVSKKCANLISHVLQYKYTLCESININSIILSEKRNEYIQLVWNYVYNNRLTYVEN